MSEWKKKANVSDLNQKTNGKVVSMMDYDKRMVQGGK
jgi:hypothetical protein